MMKNPYQKLTDAIHVPTGLNERVLFEARRRTAEQAGSSLMEPQSWERPMPERKEHEEAP